MMNSKKAHFGNKAYALTITVVTVVCAVLICVFADLADDKYALKADFSYNEATVQSRITDEMLRSLEHPVHIIMLSSGNNEYDVYFNESNIIEVLLNRYSAISEKISSEKTRFILQPFLSDIYTDELGKNAVSNDCLIIHCEETGRTRILVSEDYYYSTYDQTLGNYVVVQNYEGTISQAIAYVSSDELPVIQFTAGHGEIGNANLSVMISNLEEANYSISFIDLSTEDPDPSYPLFILSPKHDFSANEVHKMEEFALNGGDFFVTFDSAISDNIPNFTSFLFNWGICPVQGILLSQRNSINSIPNYVKPDLMPAVATNALISADETDYWLVNATAFQSTESIDNSYKITKILICGDSYITDDLQTMRMIENDRISDHDVCLLSERIMASAEMSRLLIIGDAEMFIDDTLNSKTSARPFLLEMTQYINPSRPAELDIKPHKTQRDTITAPDLTPSIVFVMSLPLLVLILALTVLLPRRHK